MPNAPPAFTVRSRTGLPGDDGVAACARQARLAAADAPPPASLAALKDLAGQVTRARDERGRRANCLRVAFGVLDRAANLRAPAPADVALAAALDACRARVAE